MNKPKKIMIIAGGTGGHVFPGLAVANFLINQGWKVRWLGTPNHIEANLVPKYDIKIDFIRISGLRGKGIKTLILAPLYIFSALRKAINIIKCFNPDIVLGFGGYVSGPGCIAAWTLGIPIILHEQNSVAGLTNKYLAKIASKVIQAFPEAFPKASVVGNPVRNDILELPKPEIRLSKRNGPLRVLVVGGSQGAHIFNHVIPQATAKLGKAVVVWHQSGKSSLRMVKQSYIDTGQPQHKVVDFIDNIAIAYAWADIIICRAGALTVSEIAIVGLPALFVPYQHKDRQQYFNAIRLERLGAAKIIEQSKFTSDIVVNVLNNWNDRSFLIKMARRARILAIRDSTEKVVKEIRLIAKKYNI